MTLLGASCTVNEKSVPISILELSQWCLQLLPWDGPSAVATVEEHPGQQQQQLPNSHCPHFAMNLNPVNKLLLCNPQCGSESASHHEWDRPHHSGTLLKSVREANRIQTRECSQWCSHPSAPCSEDWELLLVPQPLVPRRPNPLPLQMTRVRTKHCTGSSTSSNGACVETAPLLQMMSMLLHLH